MDGRGKSDDPVVPAKPANNAQDGAAESVEGRGSAEGNVASETRSRHRAGTSARLVTWLACAERHERTRTHGSPRSCTTSTSTVCGRHIGRSVRRPAPGIDGVTWRDYGADLEASLRDLHDRLHAGRYRAKP